MPENLSEGSLERNDSGFVLNPDEAMSMQGALERQKARMARREKPKDPEDAQLVEERFQKINSLIQAISTGQTPEGVNLELDSEQKMILSLSVDNKINDLQASIERDPEPENQELFRQDIARLQELKTRLTQ